MELIEGIKTRRSIREFKKEMVSDDLIMKAVDAAKFYPSWKNTETARFILIKDTDLKNKIAYAVLNFEHNTNIILNAPELIVVTTIDNRSGYERDGSPTTAKGSHFQSFDAGAATYALQLSLHNYGIGSVVLGIYDEAKIKEILSLGEGISVSCLLPIGYKAQEVVAPKRHTNEEFLTIK